MRRTNEEKEGNKCKNGEKNTRHEDKILRIGELDNALLDKKVGYRDEEETHDDDARIDDHIVELSGFDVHPEEARHECEWEHER